MYAESWLFWILYSLGCCALLWLALRHRRWSTTRAGPAPWCRRCDYSLHGLPHAEPGQRCPECGTHLAEKPPRTKPRSRRWLVWPLTVLISTAITFAATKLEDFVSWSLPHRESHMEFWWIDAPPSKKWGGSMTIFRDVVAPCWWQRHRRTEKMHHVVLQLPRHQAAQAEGSSLTRIFQMMSVV